MLPEPNIPALAEQPGAAALPDWIPPDDIGVGIIPFRVRLDAGRADHWLTPPGSGCLTDPGVLGDAVDAAPADLLLGGLRA